MTILPKVPPIRETQEAAVLRTVEIHLRAAVLEADLPEAEALTVVLPRTIPAEAEALTAVLPAREAETYRYRFLLIT